MASKVLINLVPVTSGGGLQNAISFIHQIHCISSFADASCVLCRRGSLIEHACIESGVKHHAIANGIIGRLWFELFEAFYLARYERSKLVFTLFGNPPICLLGIHSISGFAFSNILEPEIRFWDSQSLCSPLKKIKDFLRLRLARLSDEVILETDYLLSKAKSGNFFKGKSLYVVRMEPSQVVLDSLSKYLPLSRNDYSRFLFLCGPQPHKRVHLFAPILRLINLYRRDLGLNPATVFATFSPQTKYGLYVRLCFELHEVGQYIFFLDTVSQEKVGDLLSRVDCIVNIATLESFSNNWVEAWAAGLPLISIDAPWARASCGEAAIYINPYDPSIAARNIMKSLENPAGIDNLRKAGESILNELSSVRKIDAYWSIIHSALFRL